MNYAVGHNMPGYLPESDVWITGDWESAKQYLIDEMDRTGDFFFDTDQEDEADALSAEMEDLNLDNGPEWCSSVIGNQVWWIQLTDEEPEEDE